MSPHTLTPQQIIRKKAAGEPLHPDEPQQNYRHVITLLLENTIGALNRVSNLFSARGFNLESVTVGETDDPTVSRMTVVTFGSRRKIEQALGQLNNLVDTLNVEDITEEQHVERELCLLKVKYDRDTRAEMLDINTVFRGNIIDITPGSMTFEITGPPSKVNAFIGMMKPHGILEIARSGRVAMRRALVYGD